MNLSNFDWTIIGLYFLFTLAVGIAVSRKAGNSTQEFFLSGRNMPWWLLGVSMVATTFSADTPNLVTGLVRENGVAGNWGWWCLLFSGMLTVFVYAKLWRRSEVMTDIEFYELRYSGKAAAFLRGFRALYLGLIFNILVTGAVSLAAIKFGEIILGMPGWQTLLIAGSVTLAYSAIGGLKAVIVTDFVQFFLAMIGSIWACIYLINMDEVGGLSKLLSNPNVTAKMDLIPDLSDPNVWIPVLLVPLAVQWWASYYPGAEPGGGGYIAQRMLSAKDEKNAVGATLLFNIAHYAIRPWPWILIALASLVLYPELADIAAQFPNASTGHDLGYPAMLTHLPAGLLGLVVTSLIAAFMSTISTHLNWGSSYIALDFYKRFVNPDASEKKLVAVGRLSTVLLMILAALLALVLSNALSAFNILLQIGAGTGLIFILRWFWWRVNAYSEITGMLVSFMLALLFEFVDLGLSDQSKLVLGVGITTLSWVIVTFLTRPTEQSKLISFYQLVTPYGKGWNKIREVASKEGRGVPVSQDHATKDLASWLLGIAFVYTFLFGTGYLIYGNWTGTLVLFGICLLSGLGLYRSWRK